jgi:hypothetical protein
MYMCVRVIDFAISTIFLDRLSDIFFISFFDFSFNGKSKVYHIHNMYIHLLIKRLTCITYLVCRSSASLLISFISSSFWSIWYLRSCIARWSDSICVALCCNFVVIWSKLQREPRASDTSKNKTVYCKKK